MGLRVGGGCVRGVGRVMLGHRGGELIPPANGPKSAGSRSQWWKMSSVLAGGGARRGLRDGRRRRRLGRCNAWAGGTRASLRNMCASSSGRATRLSPSPPKEPACPCFFLHTHTHTHRPVRCPKRISAEPG